jgi:hypothetical protein
MKGPDPTPPLEPGSLLSVLVRHGVDFVVVGGVAGLAQGSSYPTYDLDVAYARDASNLSRLVAALSELQVRLRGAPPDLPFILDEKTIEKGANFTFETKHGHFDVLAHIDGISSYETLRRESAIQEIEGLQVRVASIDHLIAMKRAANRTKDKLMLEEYIALADELDRHKAD